MIQITNLTVRFPDGKGSTLTALSVPSFTLEEGGLTCVTGPSGTGKTTFLHCLSGLLTPTTGTIQVGKEVITSRPQEKRCAFRAKKVGYVFQKPLLLPYLTVAENIRLSASFAGESVTDEEISNLLAEVNLKGLEGRYPDTLSGGQQQRVSFLRAIVRKPSLLLADEPTAALDRTNGERLMQILLDYQKGTGCYLLCATHDTHVMSLFPKRYDMQEGGFL